MTYENWMTSVVYFPYFIFVLGWGVSWLKGGNENPLLIAETVIGVVGLCFLVGSLFFEVQAWAPLVSCFLHFVAVVALLNEPKRKMKTILNNNWWYLLVFLPYCWVLVEIGKVW